jgi:uncharacterized iron-regulated membrane protein
MPQSSFRRLVLVLHRWLGLGSALLLAVIGVSGAVFLLPAPGPTRVFLEKFHSTLMIPAAGQGIVIAATIAAVLLEFGGAYLWWKRKVWKVRWREGWRKASGDLHHLTGVALLPLMLLLAGTGVGRVAVRQVLPPNHVVVKATNYVHTGLRFPVPVRVAYGVGGLAFLLQGATGVIMWWPSGRRLRRLEAKAAKATTN